ncbi:MAG TPA: adenosine kinase [Burkholderiales bacterium]|nr:adenosine kinase [Burkholderiales bacterium]
MDVYGVGNALVDVQVRVDEEFIARHGLKKGHMELVDARRQAQVLDALAGHPVNRCSGGSAANTVVGVAELGGRAAYCGKVGNDALGRFYRDDLDAIGVRFDGASSSDPTGTALVLITPDAQRTMLTSLGASALLDSPDVQLSSLDGCAYLYVEGYLLPGEGTRRAALAAIEAAKSRGVRIALTVSDPFVVAQSAQLLWELIDGPIDLLFCNEIEAAALVGTDDMVECARALHRRATNIALTLGAKGSVLMHQGTLHPVEGVKVDPVDTTGAGDMYAAGILYGLTHGLSWPEAGRLASHAAARVVSTLGARLPAKLSRADVVAMSRPPKE